MSPSPCRTVSSLILPPPHPSCSFSPPHFTCILFTFSCQILPWIVGYNSNSRSLPWTFTVASVYWRHTMYATRQAFCMHDLVRVMFKPLLSSTDTERSTEPAAMWGRVPKVTCCPAGGYSFSDELEGSLGKVPGGTCAWELGTVFAIYCGRISTVFWWQHCTIPTSWWSGCHTTIPSLILTFYGSGRLALGQVTCRSNS